MNDLPKRTLGRTGLDVTLLGYGAMELRGERGRRARPLSAGQADAVLGAVLDEGINFVDTSIDYGESEEAIGKAIGHRRDEYFLASKAGCPFGDAAPAPSENPGPLPHDYSRANIRAGLERSLDLLQTDHLDLLQLHISPSLETIRRDDVIDTLIELRDEGKVRFLGSSSTIPNIWDHLDLGVFDAYQIPYSALEREHEEAIAEARRRGAGVIIRGGVAKGSPRPDRPSQATDRWELWDKANLDELLDPGQSPVDFILRYTLTNPDISTIIVGTASADHLHTNAAQVRLGPLSHTTYHEARRRLSEAGAIPVGR